MLSKSLIQFSVDARVCVPFWLFGLRTNCGRGNGRGVMAVTVTSFRRAYIFTVAFSALQQSTVDPPPPLETPGHSQASLAQSLVGTLLLSPVHTRFCLGPPKSVSPVLWKFYNQISLASKVKFPGDSQSLCRISRLGNLLCVLELP